MQQSNEPRTFRQITDELVATWRFSPQGNDRGILSAKIAEWCRERIERGEWLLSVVDDFDEYPGAATLRKLIKDKFEPAGPLAPYHLDTSSRGVEPEVLPPVECQVCCDSGTLMEGRTWRWCTCPGALRLRDELPNWLDTLNRTNKPGSRLREEQRAQETHQKLAHLMGGYGDSE